MTLFAGPGSARYRSQPVREAAVNACTHSAERSVPRTTARDAYGFQPASRPGKNRVLSPIESATHGSLVM